MSLAELMPLVESLSPADRQQLISFLSIQQPELVLGPSLAQPPETGMAGCYGICADDPIVLDDLGISEKLVVLVLPDDRDDFRDLMSASMSSVGFWDNPIDDEVWNDA